MALKRIEKPAGIQFAISHHEFIVQQKIKIKCH